MVDLNITPYWRTNDHKKAVQVWRIRHLPSGFAALAYVCSLEEDFDGVPRCYGEPNPGVEFMVQAVGAEARPAVQAD